MGIEPTWPAWKAGTLPLSYARGKDRSRFQVNSEDPAKGTPRPETLRRGAVVSASHVEPGTLNLELFQWWTGEDSNLRRLSQQIYSLPPLATREPDHAKSIFDFRFWIFD